MTTYVKLPAYDVNNTPLSGLAPSFSALIQDDETDITPQPAIAEMGTSAIYRVAFTPAQVLGGINGIIDFGADSYPRFQFIEIDATGTVTVSGSPVGYIDEGIDSRAEVTLANGPINSPSVVDSLVYFIKANGAPVTPDVGSCYVTILDPSGAPIVARTAATVAVTGKLSFAQVWPEATYPLYEDYCAVWEWQESGVPHADRQYFDCVRNKMTCLIDTSDLQELLPTITDHLRAIGETDCTKFIRRAWSELMDKIRAGRNRPALILDRERLINPAIKLAMMKTCTALVRAGDDIWDKRRAMYDKEYKEAWAALGELKYDIDEDGRAGDKEKTRINRKTFTV